MDILADIQETRRLWKKWEGHIVTTNRINGMSSGEISRLLPTRTASATSARWNDYLKPRLADSFTIPGNLWSQREDELLVSLHIAGDGFIEIAQKIPNRSENSCKKRWHRLKTCRPELRRRWTIIEEKTLVSLFRMLGPRWHEIAKELPGPTHRACEQHYYNPTCGGEVGAGSPSQDSRTSRWDSEFCVH